MILDNLRFKTRDGTAKISCDVDGQELYYSFPSEFAEYVTYSFDCFVLSLLPVALRLGEDMIVKGTMSEELWNNLQYQIIPMTPIFVPKTKIAKVIPNELSSQRLPSEEAVGCALSCGVDSLATFEQRYFSDECSNSYKITHATNFCVGATGAGEVGQTRFYKKLEIIKEYLSHTDLKFLPVLSNLTDFHRRRFNSKFTATYSYRNLAVPLLFPRLFSKFYCSSGFTYEQSWLDHSVYDLALADPYLVPLMSTENVKSILACSSLSRPEKTLLISKNSLSHKYIDVCTYTGKRATTTRNCSFCEKCLRTLVTLDFYGKLEDFKSSFDMPTYFKNKQKYVKNLNKDKHFDLEILNLYHSMANSKKSSHRSLIKGDNNQD
jgi:hypothetical protein